jgi:hypothetical protein
MEHVSFLFHSSLIRNAVLVEAWEAVFLNSLSLEDRFKDQSNNIHKTKANSDVTRFNESARGELTAHADAC